MGLIRIDDTIDFRICNHKITKYSYVFCRKEDLFLMLKEKLIVTDLLSY